MTSLADDLLKSRSISDLRSLIHDLRRDGEGKRTELQSMVGSQYHEFIQSADKISGMNEQSRQLVEKLGEFWTQNQQVINHVNTLLGQKNKFQHVLEVSNADKLLEDFHPTQIWRDLSSCEIYAASVKAITAHCILQHIENKASHFTQEVISKEMKATLSKMNITASRMRDLRSSAFLIETISDDARIFCLEDSDGEAGMVEQKAKALAALEVLTQLKADDLSASSSTTTTSHVIDIYLHCADLRLQNLFETKLRNAEDSADIDRGLVLLVQLLQTIIVDIYVLFFHHIPIGDDKMVNGLVSYYHLKLLQDVNSKCSTVDLLTFLNHLDVNGAKQHMKAARTWLQDQIKGVTEKCSTLLSALTSAMQVAQLQQQVYSSCISVASSSTAIVTAQSTLTMPNFSSIWNDACNELLVHKSAKHKRTVSTNNAHSHAVDTALLLWSTVFRASFLHQVERLLQKSCEDILHDVEDQMVQMMASFGLSVSLNHHQASVVLVAKDANKSPKFTSAKIYMLAERIRAYFDSALGKLLDDVITPVHQSEMMLQQKDSNHHQNNDNSNSALSGQALMAALKSNCAKLVGQFLSTLRRIAEGCKSALMSQGQLQFKDYDGDKFDVKESILHASVSKVLKEQFTSSSKLHNHTEQTEPDNAVLSSLLLIGRIAWLMKIRSHATKSALMDSYSATQRAGKKSSSLHSASTDLEVIDSSLVNSSNVSEEQFRSAFEIADTDGDGIVERSEALEALQALSVGDQFADILSDHHATSSHRNSLSSVSSLSYEEFVLVFGAHLFAADVFRPFQRLLSGLDHIIGFSHMVWIVSLVRKHSADLHRNLLLELSLDKSTNDQQMSIAPFKVHWAPKWIDLDGSADDKTKEQIMLPSRYSTSSNQFIYDITSDINHYLVSIDTMQAWYSDDTVKKELTEDDQDDDAKLLWSTLLHLSGQQPLMLCRSLSQLAYEIALDQLRHAYNHALQALLKASKVSSNSRKQESMDDIAMQLVVDLTVFDQLSQGLLGGIAGKSSLKVRAFDRLLSRSRSCLDPVMAELASQPLQQSVEKIIDKTKLLFFPNEFSSSFEGNGESKDLASSSYTSSSNISQEVLGKLFPVSTGSSTRCALLPLALTTSHSAGNSISINNKKAPEKASNAPKSSSNNASLDSKNKSATANNIMKWW